MSTTPPLTDPTPTPDYATINQTGDARASRARRAHAGAPQMFSTTNRKPLPPAFEEESWATGEP